MHHAGRCATQVHCVSLRAQELLAGDNELKEGQALPSAVAGASEVSVTMSLGRI